MRAIVALMQARPLGGAPLASVSRLPPVSFYRYDSSSPAIACGVPCRRLKTTLEPQL